MRLSSLHCPAAKCSTGRLQMKKGQFRFRDVNTSTYELQATFIGYEPKITKGVTTTPVKPDLDLGKIMLVSQGVNLDEIVVAEEAPVMESKIDKLVYNADKDITNLGGDGADVLRKVPLLSVDLDGNVSLRGNSNVRIFYQWQTFFHVCGERG
jgi:ferric enterobactin receptor